MSIYKRGNVYWYKFTFNGEAIRESTRQKNQHTARQMEAAHRASLAKGEVGIRDKKHVPTLAEFLEKDFLPYVDVKHAEKLAPAARPLCRRRGRAGLAVNRTGVTVPSINL